MRQQDYPESFLTKGEIEAEARERLRLYRKARKGKSGPEPKWRMFVTAGYLLLKKKKHRGTRLTEVDADVIRSYFGIQLDPKNINRWIHGPSYRSTIEWEAKEFSRWIGRPFCRAVSLVLAGLEGKPAPSRRELMRCFRVPGSKNCSAEELAQFQGMIDREAAEIAAKPNPNDPNLDPAHNDLIPNPTGGS